MRLAPVISRRWSLAAVFVAWSAAWVVGFSALAAHQARPGPPTGPPAQWPPQSRIVGNSNELTLLMFVHPHCPCTNATLSELERVLARSPHAPPCRILFVRPERQPEGWERAALWNRAALISGVACQTDVGGVEAKRFKVRTSGHVLLYDRFGELLYSGGITPLRAHEGDSVGKLALLDRLSGVSAALASAEVFGCPLLDSEPEPQ